MTPGTGPALIMATGYSGVIRLVQWCVVALILLFFLRVIRAVFVEVRPAGPRQTRRDRWRARREQRRGNAPEPLAKGQLALEIVEPGDRAGHRFVVDGGLTVGRSADCEISTAYDIYSSGRHAQLFYDGKRLMVEDMGSTNGTFVNAERIVKPTKVGKGDMVQVGGTVFEVVR